MSARKKKQKESHAEEKTEISLFYIARLYFNFSAIKSSKVCFLKKLSWSFLWKKEINLYGFY
jgi:hypothetical protein